MSGYAQGGPHDQYDDPYAQHPHNAHHADPYYQDQGYYDQQDYSQHGDTYYDR